MACNLLTRSSIARLLLDIRGLERPTPSSPLEERIAGELGIDMLSIEDGEEGSLMEEQKTPRPQRATFHKGAFSSVQATLQVYVLEVHRWKERYG